MVWYCFTSTQRLLLLLQQQLLLPAAARCCRLLPVAAAAAAQMVVHYQLPASADTYIHRSGRTARTGGNDGVALVRG
jgi:hypothetical protein